MDKVVSPWVGKSRSIEQLRYFYPYTFLRTAEEERRKELFFSEYLSFSGAEIINVASDTGACVGRRLNWDSEFFKSEIYRIDFAGGDSLYDIEASVSAWEAEFTKRGGEYAFCQIPVESIQLLDVLGRRGWSTIETRLTYAHQNVKQFESPRYPARAAEFRDMEDLCDVAEKTVNPFDRFHDDPFFNAVDVNRLMRKWIEASIMEEFADITLVPASGPAGAFMTIKYLEKDSQQLGIRVSQNVLSAVSPACRGWYRRLVSESLHHLRERGTEVFFLTTQITNRAVTHTLESLGFHLGGARIVMRKSV